MVILKTGLEKCKGMGKIISNGLSLQEHEENTVRYFIERGFDIELVRPANTPKSKNPDIMMASLIWEMKSPHGKGKNNIDHIFKKAAKQSENLIIDLRRYGIRNAEKARMNIERRFKASHRVRKICIITIDGELIFLEKS